ncbi:D-alanyl-D-alanine carboxypeptidase [Brevundimonas sp. LM2]|uniref:M15 family metallopeptidase n=1 Tax=Brevundimonas sp. LM2 TaxID=1938605 RepID=UPI000983A3A0|nr:M15 family metallopeptidase [Brevundimonas sp. LM2]AQR62095.1 D-alanyl-D-alanine carboxypeptidase [Brevundimonas sp. LM2]
MRLAGAMRMAVLIGILAGVFGLTTPARAEARCDSQQAQWAGAAFANAISEYSLEWSPFGSTEWGWVTYVPLLQQEIGTDCPANSPDFAAALAGFQSRHGLAATGIFDQPTFQILRGLLQERRPFVMARVRDECPDPPPIRELGYLVESEEHADRLTRLLRRDVLDAYRRLVAAARAEVPEVRNDPELLQIFSGFRDPEADAARCAASGNCDGLRRAVCSPHRTGTAVDLYVGELLGMGVDSTHPASRLHMSQGATYRWLVKNAGRFGFVPYLYEPWHWEWVGPSTPYGTP